MAVQRTLTTIGLELLADALAIPSAEPKARNTYRLCFVRSEQNNAVARSIKNIVVVAPDRVKAVALFAAHSEAVGKMIADSIMYEEHSDVINGQPLTLPTIALFAAHSKAVGKMLADSIMYEEHSDVINGQPLTLPTIAEVANRVNRMFGADDMFDDEEPDWWFEETINEEPVIIDYGHEPLVKAAGRG